LFHDKTDWLKSGKEIEAVGAVERHLQELQEIISCDIKNNRKGRYKGT
jgi:hypothetical protein